MMEIGLPQLRWGQVGIWLSSGAGQDNPNKMLSQITCGGLRAYWYPAPDGWALIVAIFPT